MVYLLIAGFEIGTSSLLRWNKSVFTLVYFTVAKSVSFYHRSILHQHCRMYPISTSLKRHANERNTESVDFYHENSLAESSSFEERQRSNPVSRTAGFSFERRAFRPEQRIDNVERPTGFPARSLGDVRKCSRTRIPSNKKFEVHFPRSSNAFPSKRPRTFRLKFPGALKFKFSRFSCAAEFVIALILIKRFGGKRRERPPARPPLKAVSASPGPPRVHRVKLNCETLEISSRGNNENRDSAETNTLS